VLALGDLLSDLDVRVVAGEAGLERAVRWVHISELLDPTPFLTGGELLLTTGLQLDTAERQREYVARLVAHGLAGLGLGTGLGHDTVPEALREAAEAAGFPLFEVPYEVPFIAVTEKAAAHLVAERYALLQRALAAHERLERVVLAEGGLETLTATLAGLVGGLAVVLDAHGERLAGEGRWPEAELRARLAERPARELALEGGVLALPVPRHGVGRANAESQAWLVGAPATELDRLILRQAVTIVALELLRRRVAADTERRLAGDVLTAMLAGELAGPELGRRLAPFGLRGRAGTLVLAPPRAVRAQAEDALDDALREEVGGGLAAGAGRLLTALLPPPPGEDAELFALAERVRARVAQAVGEALPAGAGRAVALAELRRGFHEARCALEARELGAAATTNGGGPPLLATYRDLGSFQLLLSLQDDEALRLFCDSILAPIQEGEGAYGGELMRSVEAFIECNGQWERAARQLYCHRHTLRYRIRRVEELTGRSLDSARDRIDFWLALRGRELLRTGGS